MRIGSTSSGIDLTAQNGFRKAIGWLNQSSLRLSTLLRINRGSDDPAGLIAAGSLRAELTALEAASANATRAVGVAHVADAALSGVGDLIQRARGDVLEAAGGFLSDDELQAKQIEVDAALEAINRIGQTTSFAGRHLLTDGSSSNQVTLSFDFSPEGNQPSTLTLPKIETARLGGASGHLSDLASGGSASLSSGNFSKAAQILDEAGQTVLNAGAEVGSFERYTIDSSQNLLDSMEVSLSSALSAVQDADFAQETSHLIQAQMLAKTAVLVMSLTAQRNSLWDGVGSNRQK